MNKEILERFFNDEASESEIERVLAWFEAQELDPDKSRGLAELWQEIDESDYVVHDGDRLLENIHRDIKKSDLRGTVDKRFYGTSSYSKYGLSLWVKAAAVLIVAAGLFVFWTVNSRQTGSAISDEQQVTRVAKAGEKKTLTLSDGSIIRLNADSRLTFPEKFSETAREVYLTGEAFFEVSEDSTRPFIVQTGVLTTTVLGTSFNIKSYAEDMETDISLASGKLKVESDDSSNGIKSYILNSGEAAVLDKRDSTLIKGRFDPELSLGWTRGMLVFQDADIDELIKGIERWYGVTVEVENPENTASEEWRYRGVFKNEPLENVLKGISYVKDFTYEIEKKRVKIVF